MYGDSLPFRCRSVEKEEGMSEHPSAALDRRMLPRFEESDVGAFEDAIADDVLRWFPRSIRMIP